MLLLLSLAFVVFVLGSYTINKGNLKFVMSLFFNGVDYISEFVGNACIVIQQRAIVQTFIRVLRG